MTIGERIKIIRTFRGMTQKELGLKIGYADKNADVRIAQYESNYRIPKNNTLVQIAKILDINYIVISDYNLGCAEDIIETLFWLDELNQDSLVLFPMKETNDNKIAGTFDPDLYITIHTPVGIAINYGLVNEFLEEWLIRKNELKNSEITREEYFEWKINWPNTCEGNRVVKQWRKNKE